MTIDDLAGRLEAAAGQVADVRAELEHGEPVAAATGAPAREVLSQIRQAWIEQRELAARAAEQIRRLAGDVAQAAQTYRAADEPIRDRGGWST